MGILDFVLLGFLLVTVIIGLKRGFAKMISNFLCVVVALGGSVIATSLLIGVVKGLDLYVQLQVSMMGLFSQPFMTTAVASPEALTELLAGEGAGAFSVLGGLSAQIFEGMQLAGVDTLSAFLGDLLATIIAGFAIWLVSYILLKYICIGLKKLICLIAGVPVIKSIDKIIGAVFSVAFGYVIVFGVLYPAFGIVCAKFFPDLGAQVVAMANQSMLFSYVHHTNVIGDLLCGMFQVDYATFAPIV